MPNDDLRADISAAFDAAPEPTPATDTPAPAPERVESSPVGASSPPEPVETPVGKAPETAAEARARDEKGRFAKAQADAAAPPVEAPVASPTPPVDVPKPVEAPKPPVETIKAPQSWRPNVREKFNALPPEVQQEVIRREREVEQTQRESAEARQGYQRFREVMAPFEHMVRAEGSDPYRTVGSLMQTAMALQSGAPRTKAQIVANLIQHYGVDLNSLAATLEGQPVPETQAQPYRDPRVDELLGQVQQAKAVKQQQMAAEAQRLIGEIQGEEFFGDVKDAMADILEIAAKRGVAMTPREAYNRAVWADPHVAEVLQQRQAAAQSRDPERGHPASGGGCGQHQGLTGSRGRRDPAGDSARGCRGGAGEALRQVGRRRPSRSHRRGVRRTAGPSTLEDPKRSDRGQEDQRRADQDATVQPEKSRAQGATGPRVCGQES